MAKLEYPISSEYVARWGLFEGVRELLQNARDAAVVNGAEMTIEHYPRTKRLVIRTVGASIDARALLMGYTTKAGDARAAGQYGEGLKLALLALCREGHDVSIQSNGESWSPTIERSAAFGNERVLCIYTRKISMRNEVLVEVDNVTAEEWADIKPRFLFVDKPAAEMVVETDNGKLLLEERYFGKIFCKGIFVQKLEDVTYGYDLESVDVDRDRRMVDIHDARYEMSAVLGQAARKHEAARAGLYSNLKDGREDGSYVYALRDEVVADVLVRFRAEFGHDAFPCADEEECRRVRALGGVAVIVPAKLREVLQKVLGSLYSHVAKLTKLARTSVDPSMLTPEENAAFEYALECVAGAGHDISNISVVESAEGDDTLGQCDLGTGDIVITRRALGSRMDALRTVIHELAHHITGSVDGSLSHVATIEKIWMAVFASKKAGT